MPNSTTIKILCERSKRYKVLNLLHDLLEITTDFSPPEAIAAYFPQAQSHPFTVEKFPKSAQACGTYVNELASYALGNPQSDEIEDPYESYASATTATKRNRQGEPVAQASTVKTVTQPSQNVLQQLEENQKKLNAIEQDQLSRETTMSKLDETLKRLDSRVSTNDAAITKLANAQITQGNLINTINKKQTFMENTIIKLCDHFNIEVERPTQESNIEDTEMEGPPDDLHTQTPEPPPPGIKGKMNHEAWIHRSRREGSDNETILSTSNTDYVSENTSIARFALNISQSSNFYPLSTLYAHTSYQKTTTKTPNQVDHRLRVRLIIHHQSTHAPTKI